MTREEALRRVKGYLTDIIPAENYSEIEEIIKALKVEPPWIPCSEKLPRGQTQVLISGYDDSGDIPIDYTDCGWMTKDGKYWIVDNDIDNFVVAWMPMPKPYKVKKEGKDGHRDNRSSKRP